MGKKRLSTYLLVICLLCIQMFSLFIFDRTVYAKEDTNKENIKIEETLSYSKDINNQSYVNNQNSNSINTMTNGKKNDQTGKVSEDDNKEIDIDEIGGSAKGQIEKLYDYINKMKTNVELMEDLDPVQYIKTYIDKGEGTISFKTILKGIASLFFKEVKSVLALVISIITIAIICSLLKNLQDAFGEEGISEVAFYACYALIIMILSKSFIISISVAKNLITSISEFMNALLPILATMIGVAGGVTQATTLDPFIVACVVIIPKIYSNIIIPLILMVFVLEFANNLSKEHKITNLCSLIKQCVIWFQGIIVTSFIALLTIRGITSSTLDAVTLKTAKFAVDNFIPIVGKAFSDAISQVAGYSLLIKNAISSIGLLVIVLIMIYPIIKLVIMTFIYKLSAALIEPISDPRITKSLEATGKSMVLIISCVLTISLMFFILIAIMAQAGSFVVGG